MTTTASPTLAGTKMRIIADGVAGTIDWNKESNNQSILPNQDRRRGLIVASFDTDVDGTAIGDYVLKADGKAITIPKGSIILQGIIDVTTQFTSTGSATIDLQVQSANDLLAAGAVADLGGIEACVPVGTAATAIKLTAERNVTLSINAVALTAGACTVLLDVLYGNPAA